LATSFDDVYNTFLEKISDSDLLTLDSTNQESLLYGYMIRSCTKFNRICKVDLTNIDDELKQFNNDLNNEIIDIITTGMIVEWLKPKYLFNENLHNVLNTKDYNQYSPANLLKEIRETYLNSKQEFVSMMNNYSYINGNIEDLKP
jgi:hypothetical protein